MFKLYVLIPALLLLALFVPSLGARWFRRRIESPLNRLAQNTRLAVAVIGLVSTGLNMAVTDYAGIPVPEVSDEFGNLLNADTFVRGRLSNPTHPMWVHFESIHIIHQPTYISKYPPGQGMVLAVGQWIWKPVVGVWLSNAFACMAIYWMLLAWVPRRWALLGGLLSVFHPQMIAWGQNYWGGAVAVVGGSLVAGAFRRILREQRVRDALLMGLGMAVLANTRPYEGFVLSLLLGGSTILWVLGKKGPPLRVALTRVLVPLSGVLLVTAVQIGSYNRATTGNWLRMPYMVHEETYGVAPLFLWQKPGPEPVFRHKVIRDLQAVHYRNCFESQRSLHGALRSVQVKLHHLGQGYLWSGLLLIPLLGLPWAFRRDPWIRFALGIIALFTLAMLMGTWVFTHYAAPVTDLFFFLVLQSMRHLRTWRWRGQRSGLFLARGTLVLCLLSVPLVAMRLKRDDPNDWYMQRVRVLEEMERQPGKHLIFVRYAPKHNPNREWVYNPADLDGAKVLLAREMGAAPDRDLAAYFSDRKLWLIEADAPRVTPVPYAP